MSTAKIRQIVLDTETTGMNKLGAPYEGHRIIEIGALEMVNRRLTGECFHEYMRPDRLVDPQAYAVHGISDAFLADKPPFSDVAVKFLAFVRGAELIIHNAAFDIGFIDQEFRLLNEQLPNIESVCTVTDTLLLARRLFPGKRNNLDALCDRYHIDNSKRTLHGALLDAEILAEVYLTMSGGQASLAFTMENGGDHGTSEDIRSGIRSGSELKIVYASVEEIAAHEEQLNLLAGSSPRCLWRTV